MAHSSSSPKAMSKSHAWWRGIPGEEHVVKLDSSNYDHSILRSDKPAFVMFYAQWCDYSIAARNASAAVADQLANEGHPIMFAAVDADESKEICNRYLEVNGYPCFLYFSKGVAKMQYLQQHTREGFHSWLTKKSTLDSFR